MKKHTWLGIIAISILLNNCAFAQNAETPITSPFKQMQTQPKTNIEDIQKTEPTIKQTPKNLTVHKAEQLSNPKNQLTPAYAENQIERITALIKTHKLTTVQPEIEPLMDWLNDATEYHTNLFKVLKDIENAQAQADMERDLALKFAIMRDNAAYQAALLYIDTGKPRKAVGYLVDIVRSQPSTELGFKAYSTLQNLGFTGKVSLGIK